MGFIPHDDLQCCFTNWLAGETKGHLGKANSLMGIKRVVVDSRGLEHLSSFFSKDWVGKEEGGEKKLKAFREKDSVPNNKSKFIKKIASFAALNSITWKIHKRILRADITPSSRTLAGLRNMRRRQDYLCPGSSSAARAATVRHLLPHTREVSGAR